VPSARLWLDQPLAPLISASLIAPDWMPHFVRLRVYAPLDISSFTAAKIGCVMPLCLGIAMP